MVNLLYTEFLKLKRAKMFQISVIGAASAPVMMFISLLNIQSKKPDEPILFSVAFYNTNMYVLMLMGTLLYGVITAYLFNREYTENTLKNLLTIPVSKMSLIASKLVLLLIWILGLTLLMWGLTLILGLIGQFEGLTRSVLLQSLKQYLLGGCFFFLLSMPTMWVTLLFKNFVPTIIFTAVITMANILVADSEYIAVFPWTAAHVIANNAFVPEYPHEYSYIVILITSLIGFGATIIHFKKSDIH